MMVTKEVIKEWAKELYEEHADSNGDMFADSTLQALQIMGERAAGLSDPERPQVERMEDGYKITYNGIDYQAKGGFISIMAPNEVNSKSLLYDMQKVINRHSLENNSNTPDYALAAFLLQVLLAYGVVVKKRDDFHEAVMSPPFKSGGRVSNNTGCFEDVPVIVIHQMKSGEWLPPQSGDGPIFPKMGDVQESKNGIHFLHGQGEHITGTPDLTDPNTLKNTF